MAPFAQSARSKPALQSRVQDGSRPAEPAVRVRNVTRAFGQTVVLRGLDLQIGAGEFVALLGRSGSGKTTLLRTLAGLDDAEGQDVLIPQARAVVFQEPRLLPWRKVWRNVALGLKTDDPRGQAERALGEVGLSHRLDAWPATLSGGEAQRVALARALVREPRLLLLDEPFAALDALTRLKMHDLVLTLWRNHAPAVLFITHDVDEAVTLADRVLVLEQGRIIAEDAIDLPRPRAADAEFQALRRRLLGHLGVDSEIHAPREAALAPFPARAAG